MPKVLLTDRKILSLKPKATRYDLMDEDESVPGLGVHVTPKGHKSFVLYVRYPGSSNPTRRALGSYGALSLEQARVKARRWLALISKGIDPSEDEEREKREAASRQTNTFDKVAETYFRTEVHSTRVKDGKTVPAMRRGKFVEATIKREFLGAIDLIGRRLGERHIADVRWADLDRVIQAKKDAGKPVMARHMFALIRAMFSWAVSKDAFGITVNPCTGRRAKDINPPAMRMHTLNKAELKAFWKATSEVGYPFGPLAQFLLVTAQRRNECSGAQWSEFDLDEREWRVPPERMKMGFPHIVPLSDAAVAILKSIPPGEEGDYVFSGTGGRGPFSGFSKSTGKLHSAMAAILDEDGIKLRDFTLHDLRRTARSELSRFTSGDVAERVIGHQKLGLNRVYDQYEYLDEKAKALAAWAHRIETIAELRPANVSDLQILYKKASK